MDRWRNTQALHLQSNNRLIFSPSYFSKMACLPDPCLLPIPENSPERFQQGSLTCPSP